MFTKENIESLQAICKKIDALCNEHVDGSLMYSQQVFLGELIKQFAENEIVSTSGIIILN